jgi:DNA-directed RNA polymerase specialized sigma24 family protein
LARERGCGLGTHKTDFATFMAPYVPPTARMAAALIGTVDATDAVQEALARVWRA